LGKTEKQNIPWDRRVHGCSFMNCAKKEAANSRRRKKIEI